MKRAAAEPTPSRRSKISLRAALAIGLAHLTLVALGAADTDFSRLGGFGRALAFYGDLSGASSSYGFFAPEVTGQFRVLFDVMDRSGAAHARSLWPESTGEASLRFGDIIDQFAKSSGDENDDDESDGDASSYKSEFARSLAASLAGAMFARQPDAQAVRVRLEEFLPVDMGAFRAGVRPRWHPLYQAKFVVDDAARRPSP